MKRKRGDIMGSGPPAEVVVETQPLWLRKRVEWFMDLRFGLFIHWGPYCQWDCCESWPLVPADAWARPDSAKCWVERGKDLARFSRDYWALNRTFNPARFDPDAWAETAERAGMRYITFTTKHHDGFCMFDTATTDYRITHPDCPFHSSPRANIAREVFEAFRRKGMAISCYFSKSDWHSPYYWSPDAPPADRNPNYDTLKDPERWSCFVAFAHRQVEELMTGYGHIDLLWLDGGQVRPPMQDIQMARLAAMARTHQPGLIMVDRTVGGAYENVITPEQSIPGKPLDVAWESCLTLGDHWKFVPDDRYKSAHEVVHVLIETAAKGGNLLLGVGPDPEGRIPPRAETTLREIGHWLGSCGEAIYGSRPVSPYLSGPGIRFTRKGEYTYAFVLRPPGGEGIPPRVHLAGCQAKPGSRVELLNTSVPVAWQAGENGLVVEVPRGCAAADPALVYKFESWQTS